jgi:cell division transport system ATP-binding protein
MIRLTRAGKRYGAREALADINWEVGEGEFCVVLGPSGAGKTTLLRLISMETLPTEGQVQVGSFVSGRVTRGQRAQLRRTLGVVFEDFRLLPDRNLFENIALVLRINDVWDRDTLVQRVDEVLTRVGLPGRAHAFPHELSAGQKQRAASARAIVNRPLVVLADEPTGNLDAAAGREILELLRETHEAGTAVILVTYDEDVAARAGARIVRLKDGRLYDGALSGVPSGVSSGAPSVASSGAPS